MVGPLWLVVSQQVSHVSVLVTAAGAATQQVVDETTETGQKGLVGLVGRRVDSPSVALPSTQPLPRHTLSSADPLPAFLPGEGDPGQANPAGLWFPRAPHSTALSFPFPAMDQVAKSTEETIDKTANQASEAFSGLGKILRLLK